MENLESYTLVELRQLAKEKGIKNVSKLKKEELIEYLTNIQGETTSQSEEEVSTEIPKRKKM